MTVLLTNGTLKRMGGEAPILRGTENSKPLSSSSSVVSSEAPSKNFAFPLTLMVLSSSAITSPSKGETSTLHSPPHLTGAIPIPIGPCPANTTYLSAAGYPTDAHSNQCPQHPYRTRPHYPSISVTLPQVLLSCLSIPGGLLVGFVQRACANRRATFRT